MTLSRTALWQNLHTPGHDTALIAPALSGWHLTGMATFLGEQGPAAVNYTVEIDDAWQARRGSVRGIAGGRRFFHQMERTTDGWMLDGKWQGQSELVDLDFGFTPATNFQQLKRAGLAVGERAGFSVAWFDIGKDALVDLPQIYERRDETHYWYQSPTSGYEAMLELDESGFVRVYPELWELEPASAG
ncbi:putative glycolipid-binding domain-containing protein [Mesorhizobium marinum]|uniref:putative glycolipid-binding domain-containing protein n=1 Tax=Mesorhizobium marinum TaxID=3228790 RepID=UPI003466265A